jgi:pimeloyl-ACP methyl ester carboxylesterase
MAVPDRADVVTIATTAGPIRVRDTGGAGQPVLLVHALLLDGDLYFRLVPRLVEQGRRCIVPDLPLGAHLRPARDDADLSPRGLARILVEVLDGLGLGSVDVVGVDTGGALTQLLMAHHRDRVGRVVLTACDAYEAFPPRSFAWAVKMVQMPGALWGMAQSLRFRPFGATFNLKRFTHAGAPPDVVRQWARPLLDPGVRRDVLKVLAGIDPAVTLEAAELNRTFPRPVLIAWGEDDRMFPRQLGERLAADVPDARLVSLPDCAAFAALDQPERLAELIQEIASLQRAAPTM